MLVDRFFRFSQQLIPCTATPAAATMPSAPSDDWTALMIGKIGAAVETTKDGALEGVCTIPTKGAVPFALIATGGSSTILPAALAMTELRGSLLEASARTALREVSARGAATASLTHGLKDATGPSTPSVAAATASLKRDDTLSRLRSRSRTAMSRPVS